MVITITASSVKPKWEMNPFFGYNKYKITRYNPPLIAPVAPPPSAPISYGPPPPAPTSYGAPPPPPALRSYGAPPPPSTAYGPPQQAPVYRAMENLPNFFNSRMGDAHY